ncbi:unnamed protein product [Paramecium pentaurelia]|uniref:Uncharacterized protein n=1 Tax=Paramecium pentaurelia TaxID=43138 RepID=A0A8S1V072_9CILI|nr:unnamed protein product [Paramecium pentaurelia]
MYNEMTPFFTKSAPYIQGPQKQEQFGRKEQQGWKDQQGWKEKQGWKDQQGWKQEQNNYRKKDIKYRNTNQENYQQQPLYYPKNAIDNQNQQQQQSPYDFSYATQDQGQKIDEYQQKKIEDQLPIQKQECVTQHKDDNAAKQNVENIERSQLQQHHNITSNNDQKQSSSQQQQQQQQQQYQQYQQQQQNQQSQQHQEQEQSYYQYNQEQSNVQNYQQYQQQQQIHPQSQLIQAPHIPYQLPQNMFQPIAQSNPFALQQPPQNINEMNWSGQSAPYVVQYLIYPNKSGKQFLYQFQLTQENLDENYQILKAQLDCKNKINI